jgi:hypothetical protein
MIQTIEVIVSPTGTTQVQTKGFAGNSCQQASRFLEAALGKVASQELTAEYHVTQVSQQNQVDQR